MLTRFPPYLHFSLSHHQQFMRLSSLCVRREKFQTIFHLLQSNLSSHQLSIQGHTVHKVTLRNPRIQPRSFIRPGLCQQVCFYGAVEDFCTPTDS